jgi:hypothetical protein
MLLSLGVLRRVTGEAWALAGVISLLALKPLGFLSWTIVNYSPFGLFALLLVLGSLSKWLGARRRTDLVLTGLSSGLVFVSKQTRRPSQPSPWRGDSQTGGLASATPESRPGRACGWPPLIPGAARHASRRTGPPSTGGREHAEFADD